MSNLVIDIETYRTTDARILARIESEVLEMEKPSRASKKYPKNLLDRWDQPDVQAQRVHIEVAETSKDVLLAELVCVGAYRGAVDGVDGVDAVDVIGPQDEETVVLTARDLLSDTTQETVWIGHNIGFDLGVLLNRFRKYRVEPPKWFPVYSNRHWRGQVFDTMARTPCANGLNFIKLEEVCEAYGLPPVKSVEWDGFPMEGKRVGAAYEAGEFELLRDYCAADVWATWQLYRVQTAGGQWGTYGLEDEVRAQIKAIWDSGMDDTGKRLAAYSVLERNGLAMR